MSQGYIKSQHLIGQKFCQSFFPLIDLKLLMYELFIIFPYLKNSVHDYLENEYLNSRKPEQIHGLQTDVSGFVHSYEKTLQKLDERNQTNLQEINKKNMALMDWIAFDGFSDEAHIMLAKHIISNKDFYLKLPLSSAEIEYLRGY